VRPEHSQFHRLTELSKTPFFLPITTAILFMGVGDAVDGSYLTLFAVDKAHLSPLALGIFLTVLALSGIIISTAFGRWFDHAPNSVPGFLALVMTAVGYALLTVTTQFRQLMLIACLPLGTSLAAFPQLFGLAGGSWAQAFGYRSMFLACAVLSGLGLWILHVPSKTIPTDH
jgi:MFS transporter, SET family, sugar efflux transporter